MTRRKLRNLIKLHALLLCANVRGTIEVVLEGAEHIGISMEIEEDYIIAELFDEREKLRTAEDLKRMFKRDIPNVKS